MRYYAQFVPAFTEEVKVYGVYDSTALDNEALVYQCASPSPLPEVPVRSSTSAPLGSLFACARVRNQGTCPRLPVRLWALVLPVRVYATRAHVLSWAGGKGMCLCGCTRSAPADWS